VILVTVGMHTDGFPRLVQEMDRIAAKVDEDVVMQIGATRYEPRAARWFTFTTQEQMEALCEQARVIVSHAGAGSILTALRYHRPLIVVPRRRDYGEVIDDHQLELADALSSVGALLVANDICELWAKLDEAAHFTPCVPQSNGLISAVRRAVLVNGNEVG
jgi:beta-1,4-N-acetylglucosaminyltransferase